MLYKKIYTIMLNNMFIKNFEINSKKQVYSGGLNTEHVRILDGL